MSVATRPAVPVRKFSNNPLIAFYQSSIGKKLIVAVTALILILYVLGHLLVNLLTNSMIRLAVMTFTAC